jgi:hypothetical protein
LNKSTIEDDSLDETLVEEGNRRLNFIRLPEYQDNASKADNFKTMRPTNRELSMYSQENLMSTPGGNFRTMKEIHFSNVWNRLLEDELRNKATVNYFTTKPPIQPVSIRMLNTYSLISRN